MRRFARGFARSDAVRSIDLAEVDVAQDSADGRTVRLTALCVLEALAGVVER
jgi:formiminoglutamase